MNGRMSMPATSAPASRSCFAMATTPRFQPPSPEMNNTTDFGGAAAASPFTVARLSEEHGFLAREGRDLKIGARVLIFPNHSCPIVNLVDAVTVLDAAGGVETWRVDARGAIR